MTEAREPTDPETADEDLRRPLPERVRQRVVALAADELGVMTPEEVPAPLRPFARFAPTRRARLAATPIATALETDPGFRERIATRLREGLPDLVTAVESGRPPPAADPLDVAAAAYLLRPPGWTRVLAGVEERLERATAATENAQALEAAQRLRERLTEARAAARADLERLKGDLEAARTDVHELRRKLGQMREKFRHSDEARRRAETAVEELKAAEGRALGAADAEIRRLRRRLGETEAALEAARRAGRADRTVDDTRLRLLLDTIVDASRGLRRELALPPAQARPADTVPALSASPAGAVHTTQPGDDPALLDRLLALPQVHLVVDGYNVTKAGFDTLTLEEQRARLINGLGVIAAQSGAEVTCVFDGAATPGAVPSTGTRGVRVLFSPPGQSADELIGDLVAAEPAGRPLVVVSSDREVAQSAHRAGARAVPAATLLRRLARA